MKHSDKEQRLAALARKVMGSARGKTARELSTEKFLDLVEAPVVSAEAVRLCRSQGFDLLMAREERAAWLEALPAMPDEIPPLPAKVRRAVRNMRIVGKVRREFEELQLIVLDAVEWVQARLLPRSPLPVFVTRSKQGKKCGTVPVVTRKLNVVALDDNGKRKGGLVGRLIGPVTGKAGRRVAAGKRIKADRRGVFRISNLPAGRYILEAGGVRREIAVHAPQAEALP